MVKNVKHSEINDEILDQIVEIKRISWNYSFQEHIRWIKDNIKEDDFHFLLYDKGELIAYMNLVNVCVISGNTYLAFLGVGNVCTKYKGRGDGNMLMKELNGFLSETNKRGLLFCKTNLVSFYLKNHWKLIQNLHPSSDINTMAFNFNDNDGELRYNQRLF